jgi:hypothetical protein
MIAPAAIDTTIEAALERITRELIEIAEALARLQTHLALIASAQAASAK